MKYTGDLAREAAARAGRDEHPEKVRIIGYWWTNSPGATVTFPNLNRTLLSDKEWKLTSKILSIKTLTVLDECQHILGGYWDPVKLTGIVDTSGSPIPFLVERQKAEKLKLLIDRENDDVINL